MPRDRLTAAALCAAIAATLMATGAFGASCDMLEGLDLEQVEITLSEAVAAGAFRLSTAPAPAATEATNRAFERLPAFCRVAATARPSRDSEIKLEVWMPTDGWNGKLQSVGNGGWAGSIRYAALADALANGYATTSTDTGHEGSNADFVPGHPEKLIDFASRAVHVMTVAAKAIIAAHYETAPSQSYFVGCSTGGRQALSEAQRYPDDYDGIIAGAAANYPTNLQGAQVWTARVGYRQADATLQAGQLPALNAAVLKACDTLDGVEDGVIENPSACHFDPTELICSTDNGGSCLSDAQAETVRRIYAGPTTSAGQSLFPGLARGSELGWDVGPEPMSLAVDTYRILVFNNPDWDYRNFDAEKDIATAHDRIGAIMNSTDTDLRPFFSRGGKLLLYHGWNDPGISPFNTVAYYQGVRETVGAEQSDASMRLFMVPGMNHCRGGVGTDSFDAVAALDSWVVSDQAPDQLPAARERDGRVDKTRPLCPYPQVAVYSGNGSTNDAANFSCALR